MRASTWILAGVLACTSPSCISAQWRRVSRFAPPAEEAVAGLGVEATDLSACLARLGAPLWVWEGGAGSARGATLAYGWFQNRNLGAQASVALSRSMSASMSFNRIDARMQGLVLIFDDDWNLVFWRRGLLRDLTLTLRPRRPTSLDE